MSSVVWGSIVTTWELVSSSNWIMSKVIGVGSVITSKEAYEHVISIFPLSIVDICGKVIVYLYVNSVKVAPTYLALSVGKIIVHVVLVQL